MARVREVAGFSQTDLAQRAGASVPTLSRLEHGGNVSVGTVLDIVGACGYEIVVVPRGATVRIDGL